MAALMYPMCLHLKVLERDWHQIFLTEGVNKESLKELQEIKIIQKANYLINVYTLEPMTNACTLILYRSATCPVTFNSENLEPR